MATSDASMKKMIMFCIFILGILVVGVTSEHYVIHSISYEIEGRTRKYFIQKLVDTKIGDEFPDRESLDAFIKDRLQILMNERALESAEIIPSFGEPVLKEPENIEEEATFIVPVDLIVRTKDTWNLVALPYGKYDSNVGLLLALRGRDYNFFGTMKPLILNVNWEYDNMDVQTPGLETKFSYPFQANGLDWTWDLDTELTWPHFNKLDFSLDTGIEAAIPLGKNALSFYAIQSLDIGAENSAGVPYDDDYFFTNSIGSYFSWSALRTKHLGSLIVSPKLNLAYRWRPGGLIDESLAQTPVLTPSLTAAFGRVNWVGNFREGFKTDLVASYPIDLSDQSNTFILSGSTSGYLDFGFFGPSARLSGFARLDGSKDKSAGDPIRGILNIRIQTSTALFFNLDLPLRVIQFKPADWFGISWMRYLHFEQHWSPFLDIALVEADGRLFSPSDAWIGTGIEVITFPKAARSFYIRISLGWDLRDVLQLKSLTGKSPRDGKNITEIFIGIGHHY